MPTDQPPSNSLGAAPGNTAPENRAAISVLRLLHVESDEVDALKLKLTLRDQLPAGSTVDYARSLAEAGETLQQQTYDAVFFGISSADSRTLETVKNFIDDHEGTPVLILSGDDDTRAAVAAGRIGASAFLLKSKLTADQLNGALRQAIPNGEQAHDCQLSERRQEHRYPLEASAVIFPIGPDGKPGREIAAMTVDISQNGIAVLAEQDSDLVPDVCLVGVEGSDGVYRYATVEWRHRRLALPAIRFGGRFLRRTDDPLHPSKLTPRFDPQKFGFKTALDSTVLHEWVSRGILRPVLADRVQVCPECEALPTFRQACPDCGSAKTETSQVIHHFACAHVAPAAEFDGDCLACPKCRVQNLVVGADFEYLNGPRSCLECSWNDASLALIGECLRCGHRFPGQEAKEKEVYEYHVDRLDPLALLDRT